MTIHTSVPANQAILTRLLHGLCGLISTGMVSSPTINTSLSSPTTVTIHIDLCVKNLDTAVTMEVSLRRWLHRLNSLLMSSENSSPNTSEPSPPMYDGKRSSMTLLESLGYSLASLDENAISSDDVATLLSFEKRLRTILNARSQTSSTPGCSEPGEPEKQS